MLRSDWHHFDLTLLITFCWMVSLLKILLGQTSVIEIGTIMWKLLTTKGHPVFIPAVAYHMPDCDIHLFSPQSYLNLHGGVPLSRLDLSSCIYQTTMWLTLPLIPWSISQLFLILSLLLRNRTTLGHIFCLNCGQYTASIWFGKASLLQDCG